MEETIEGFILLHFLRFSASLVGNGDYCCSLSLERTPLGWKWIKEVVGFFFEVPLFLAWKWLLIYYNFFFFFYLRCGHTVMERIKGVSGVSWPLSLRLSLYLRTTLHPTVFPRSTFSYFSFPFTFYFFEITHFFLTRPSFARSQHHSFNLHSTRREWISYSSSFPFRTFDTLSRFGHQVCWKFTTSV